MNVVEADSHSTGATGEVAAKTPAFYKRRRKRGSELGQVLLRKGLITGEQLRTALQIQNESGGHLGAILRRIGACDSRAIADALIDQVRSRRGEGKTEPTTIADVPSVLGLPIRCRPTLVMTLLMLSDVLSIGLANALVWLLLPGQDLTARQQFGVVAIVPTCLAAFGVAQLYAAVPPSPPEEIRRSTITLAIVYVGSWGFAVATRSGSFFDLFHPPWLLAWIGAAILVPINRGILRARFSKRSWWGQTVVVFGAGRIGRAVVTALRRRPQLGLKPIAVLDDDPTKHGTVRVAWGDEDILVQPVEDGGERDQDDLETPSTRGFYDRFSEVESVPVVGRLELAPILAQRLGVRTAVVALPEVEGNDLISLIERYADGYTNVLVITDLLNVAQFGAPTHSLGGVLGIEVRRQLLLAGPRFAKRTMDLVLTSIMLFFLLAVLAFVALLIKIDSKGPVIYRQKRLGQDGVRFMALKFRTMYGDGEQRLNDVLERDPKLRAEYDEFHKLGNDPRVTRVGKLLRKYSLDELPQLWNVIRGEMSLVGPRPYLEREIPEMDEQEAIILRVKPGITGMWQVTERNASTFAERVQLDVSYVRSWSPWLDLYILARTVPVVLGGTGS